MRGADLVHNAAMVGALESLRPRVLVVEDEPSVQGMYEAILQREGFDVELADNGEQALDAFERQSFDLLVVDFLLPKLDGVMLLQQMIKIRMTPAIFASAVMRDELTACHLRTLGVRWFLEKPFRLNALRQTLAEAKEFLVGGTVAPAVAIV